MIQVLTTGTRGIFKILLNYNYRNTYDIFIKSKIQLNIISFYAVKNAELQLGVIECYGKEI